MSEPTVIIVNQDDSEPEPIIEPILEPLGLDDADILELAQLRADRDQRLEDENDETRRIAEEALEVARAAETVALLAVVEEAIEDEVEPIIEPEIEVIEPEMEIPPRIEHPWFKPFGGN